MASIRNFKQIEALCKQVLGKCHVMKLGHENHAQGYLEVHVIVGLKPNPSYDPEAKIGEKAERFEADERIFFVRPGLDEQELIKKKLLPIKESAIKNREAVRLLSSVSPTEQKRHMDNKTKVEIAMKLERGEEIPSDDSEDFSDQIDEFDDEPLKSEDKNQIAKDLSGDEDGVVENQDNDQREEKTAQEDRDDQVIKALLTINESVKNLAGEMSKIKKDVDKLKTKKPGTSKIINI